MSPVFSPRDRHSIDDKGPKSPRFRLTAVEITKLNNQIAILKDQISQREIKIAYYKSLHDEHIKSMQQNITPYIRRQIEHDDAGRGIHMGSRWQMHLMGSLRIRVQFLRDMASHCMAENASDESKIRDLEKEMGIDNEVLEDGEHAG